ncbi:sulfite exporter TauE/SafE family protein 4-like [Andrographis paniculata]|uniref:sulfite exporter TauE/SafE family protein 4-like n=1 Tax=Andrographis paniculata TaxID=175694 RepID=UPI0021E93145|nr:sulfite exporter TauE/SafE family protein 4-like [Andrographis paniculata]
MAAKEFVVYLLTGFSLAVVSVYWVNSYSQGRHAKPWLLSSTNGSETLVWPELKFSWRIVLATVIGFLGSACGTVGGVGGGGIFVPMLTLVVGFDTKSAAAISKCMIMGASASSVWYNMRVPHPCREVPIIDYDLALLFQPMLMVGITFGVAMSVVFPYWLITVLIIILFLGTSSRSFAKAIEMWKDESVFKKAMEDKLTCVDSRGELLIDAYESLSPKEEKTPLQIMKSNLNVKGILALLFVWICFLLLQIIKNDTKTCSTWYWVLSLLQIPVALMVFVYECVKLYKESKKRRLAGNPDLICEAAIQWTATNLAFCALCGFLGGTVGGLLGSGGGFILGPLLLEIGVIPQVASATATFVMMFSSSLSVVEFYLLKRFPIPYAVYLMSVSILAGFWGQCLVRKPIAILGRVSIIVFILSGVIFASALTMGVVGIGKSIWMIKHNEFMGFLDFCSSQ